MHGPLILPLLKIDRSKECKFLKELGLHWKVIEQDEKSTALSELNFDNIQFVDMLSEGESPISGIERLKRLKEVGRIRLDIKFLQAILEDPLQIPTTWNPFGKDCRICFDGTVLQDIRTPDRGFRYIPYLHQLQGHWTWSVSLLENCVLVYRQVSAVLARQ